MSCGAFSFQIKLWNIHDPVVVYVYLNQVVKKNVFKYSHTCLWSGKTQYTIIITLLCYIITILPKSVYCIETQYTIVITLLCYNYNNLT